MTDITRLITYAKYSISICRGTELLLCRRLTTLHIRAFPITRLPADKDAIPGKFVQSLEVDSAFKELSAVYRWEFGSSLSALRLREDFSV